MRLWYNALTGTVRGFRERLQARILSLIVLALLCLVLSLVAAWIAAAIAGARLQAEAEARWRETLRTPGLGFLSRSASEPNATTLRLRQIARRIGLDLSDDHTRQHPEPEPADQARYDAVKPAAEAYFKRLIVAPEAAFPAPGPELASYRDWAHPAIEEIVASLLELEPPTEIVDPTQDFDYPLPNLLGHLYLHRLLLLDAVAHLRADEVDRGMRCLDASWRLADPLRQRPELISVLIGQVVLRTQLSVLRRLPFRPPGWTERLRQPTPIADTARALWFEAWVPWVMAREDLLIREMGLEDWTWPLIRPWVDAMGADFACRIHRTVSELELSDPRTFDPDSFFAEHRDQIPSWNFVGAILFPHVWDTWPRAHRIALDLELTAHLLDLRRPPVGLPPSPPGDDGAPAPPELPEGRVSSSAVAGVSWSFRRTGDEVEISLVGGLRRLSGTHPQLPVDARLHLPTGRASFSPGHTP